MSDKVEPVKPVENQADPPQSKGYPWMGLDQNAFVELNPADLPPMLRKAYQKHRKAAKMAGKGK